MWCDEIMFTITLAKVVLFDACPPFHLPMPTIDMICYSARMRLQRKFDKGRMLLFWLLGFWGLFCLKM